MLTENTFWLFSQIVGVVVALILICATVLGARYGLTFIRRTAEIAGTPIRQLAELCMVGMGAFAKIAGYEFGKASLMLRKHLLKIRHMSQDGFPFR